MKDMTYRQLTENDLDTVVKKYVEYYNEAEDGYWTYEKAYKRIHQILTIEDSMCLIQFGDDGEATGFVIGFFKQYDDLLAYYLEEIVIFKGLHGKGYGTDFLAELQRRASENGAEHIELVSVNDEHHLHFYKKSGLYAANNLLVMGKHFT